METERQLKPRVVACRDCGVALVYSGKGRPPSRCPECYTEHMRRKGRECYQKRDPEHIGSILGRVLTEAQRREERRRAEEPRPTPRD